MPEEDAQKHFSGRGKRVMADLTEAEYRELERVARLRGLSVEALAGELVSAGVCEHARKASGQSGISASVTRFHRARGGRDG